MKSCSGISPAGEGYFKQSHTHFRTIATKIITMSIDVFRDPVRLVDDISALDIVRIMLDDAPGMLPELLDGHIRRSRVCEPKQACELLPGAPGAEPRRKQLE